MRNPNQLLEEAMCGCCGWQPQGKSQSSINHQTYESIILQIVPDASLCLFLPEAPDISQQRKCPAVERASSIVPTGLFQSSLIYQQSLLGVGDFFYDIKELQEFQTSDLYTLYWQQERDNSLIPNHSKHKAKQNKTNQNCTSLWLALLNQLLMLEKFHMLIGLNLIHCTMTVARDKRLW